MLLFTMEQLGKPFEEIPKSFNRKLYETSFYSLQDFLGYSQVTQLILTNFINMRDGLSTMKTFILKTAS